MEELKRKEKKCANLIPGWGLFMPLTMSVAQTVKGLPTMRETWVRSPGWEVPPEKEIATHFSLIVWKMSTRPQGSKQLGWEQAPFPITLA